MSSDLMRQVGEQANRHNPWPLYAQLRQDRVVPLAKGSYAMGRYDDVLAFLHDPRVSSDAHTLTEPGDRIVLDTAPFINRDPPDHDRLRRVATRYFGPPDSPGVVNSQQPEIQRQIDALIGAFPESGEVDVVDAFSYPLPVAVLCRLLGVPPADEPQFRVWAGQVVGSLDAANLEDSQDAVKSRNEGLLALLGYLGDLVKKHRASPDGSMLSGLANDHEADAMTDQDLLATAGLLLIAGHETTVNLISNGTLTLLRNPDALARLRRDPGWAIPMVEELLRLEPPVQYLPNRAALTDITIDGTTIPKGAQLTLLLAAANRDPARFTDPDRFDPDRPDNQHLGFGSGLHYCFGAPLARLEVQLALTALASRLDNPRLTEDPPPYRPSPVLRGPVHLPVAYDARRTS